MGKEFDLLARFPVGKFVNVGMGYAHFWAGGFTEANSQLIDPQRRDNSDFFYTQISVSAF